jgi:hypothetical protein
MVNTSILCNMRLFDVMSKTDTMLNDIKELRSKKISRWFTGVISFDVTKSTIVVICYKL